MTPLNILIISTLILTSLGASAQRSDEAYLKSKVPNIDESRAKLLELKRQESLNPSKEATLKRKIFEDNLNKIEATTIQEYHKTDEYRMGRQKELLDKAAAENLKANTDPNNFRFYVDDGQIDNGTPLLNKTDKPRILALKAKVERFHEFTRKYGRDGLLTLAGSEDELKKILAGTSLYDFEGIIDDQYRNIFKKKSLYDELMKKVDRLEALLPASMTNQIDDVLAGKIRLVRPDQVAEVSASKVKGAAAKASGASKALKAAGKALPFAIIMGAAVANENEGPELSNKEGTPVKEKSLSNRSGTVPTAKPAGAR